MNKDDIIKQVKLLVSEFEENERLTVTQGAEDFIVEMIDKIESDPSNYWQPANTNINSLQQIAIEKIPEGLKTFIYKYRGQSDLIISSWEFWHSLSEILKLFCFIPHQENAEEHENTTW